MGKINIMHLIANIRAGEGIYGAEKMILTISRQIDRTKFNTLIVSLVDTNANFVPLLQEAQNQGILTDVIYMKGRFDFSAVFKVKKLLDKYSVDILHCHAYKADIIGLLASKFKKVQLITTLHGWTAANIKVKTYEFLDFLAVHFFDKIIIVSEYIKEKFFKKSCIDRKIIVIPNGIDVTEAIKKTDIKKIKEELNIKPQSQVIGSIGRLSHEKGHRYLLEAIFKIEDKFPELMVLLVGDGPAKRNLEKYVQKLKISQKVIFAGYQYNIGKFLDIMDIFVLPSLRESFGLVILEAMAANKPVVATNVGGIPFLVENGKTGILVPPRDSSALAEAIVELLKNRDEVERIATAGKEFVIKKFNSEIMVREYEQVYDILIDK